MFIYDRILLYKKMNRLKIGIDIDEVIRDFVGKLIEVYKREHPNHWIKPIKTWDLKPYFELGKDVSDFYLNKHAKEIYTTAPLNKGADEFLRRLRKDYSVCLVTSQPNEQIEKYTIEWLNKNKVPYDELIFSKDKGTFIGNYLLDDGIHNLERCLETGNCIPVVFDTPWNQEWTGLRVKNYEEFLKLIEND